MAPSKTWALATLEACLREADPKTGQLQRQNIIHNHLSQIVTATQSRGKTPSQTLSRILQDLRNYGFLKFVKKGVYELQPYTIDQCALVQPTNKISKGERLVKSLLRSLGINFEREKTFQDLKHKGFLRFDFYFEIDGRGFAIEFDGEQHRRPIEFFGGQEAFEQTQIRDQIKNEYCQQNNITLIRIQDCNVDTARYQIDRAIYDRLNQEPRLRSGKS